MKKLNFLLMVTLVAAVMACGDDETSPSFSKSNFIGEWEQTEPAPQDENCNDYEKGIIITRDSIENYDDCADDKISFSSPKQPYQFDGKSVINYKVSGVSFTIDIKDIGDGQMTVERNNDLLSEAQTVVYTEKSN